MVFVSLVVRWPVWLLLLKRVFSSEGVGRCPGLRVISMMKYWREKICALGMMRWLRVRYALGVIRSKRSLGNICEAIAAVFHRGSATLAKQVACLAIAHREAV